MNEKLTQLENILKGYGQVAIAFSGGVDSTFLLAFATKTLGPENVLAITAVAPNFNPDEIDFAWEYASGLGCGKKMVTLSMSQPVPQANAECSRESVETPTASPNCDAWSEAAADAWSGLSTAVARRYSSLGDVFRANPEDRCYYCKLSIFGALKNALYLKKETRDFVLCDGTNMDDFYDYRPGLKALNELKINSPLADAGLYKEDIRKAGQELGVPNHDAPAYACLASRIPYGQPITEAKLKAVAALEAALKQEGFRQVRVRHHGDIARIELGSIDGRSPLAHLTEDSERLARITEAGHKAGFKYITLDLEGYRMGNLNPQN